jgi:hypothetical protein
MKIKFPLTVGRFILLSSLAYARQFTNVYKRQWSILSAYFFIIPPNGGEEGRKWEKIKYFYFITRYRREKMYLLALASPPGDSTKITEKGEREREAKKLKNNKNRTSTTPSNGYSPS